jgi:DNA-directed RNA polymerase II subunit RPB2
MSELERSMEIPRILLDTYFQTTLYPYTRHHIDSYNQFLEYDLPAIIRSQNPLIVFKGEKIPALSTYEYKVEIFIGGLDGTSFSLGSPTIQYHGGEEARLLFPNEARLRDLTYSAGVFADILIRLTYYSDKNPGAEPIIREKEIPKYPLFEIPVMLHSKACLLHRKPSEFLESVGECPHDQGGYFIINGSEKILVTHQEQAFNTLYIQNQEIDPKFSSYSSISCMSPETRQVRRVTFAIVRKTEALHVGLPFVRKPVPICILFRALGIESDEEIARCIFPDLSSEECKLMETQLIACFTDAAPILDTFSAIQYIKSLTKGFSESHVLDIIYNQLFIHVPNLPGQRAAYLGDCVKRIYRVYLNLDIKTDRDDIRNQRCLVSGFLTQTLFQGVYKLWSKAVGRSIDEEYNYNESKGEQSKYGGEDFITIFSDANLPGIFRSPMDKTDMLTMGLLRGFRGKWGSTPNDEKAGVLQALSRLSYIDFMSHCRRVVLEFDTGMKLTGPRHLHTSQYGYFCTNETPGGASIGIAKNLSILTSISTSTPTTWFIEWLFKRSFLMKVQDTTGALRAMVIPVFMNNGLIGYTLAPNDFTTLVKLLKWTGCISSSIGVTFFIRDRRILLFFDEGRPGRPLVHIKPWSASKFPIEKLKKKGTSWRDLVMGTLPSTQTHTLSWIGFVDPLKERQTASFDDYINYLMPFSGCIEYIDPYEHNECMVVNYLEQIEETTTHVEIHPSSIMSAITSLIPFSHHNQSVRNQLGDSQSKQGISVYASNASLRYDNQAHILTNGSPPLVRTLYYDYLGEGKLPYGTNIILAMGMFQGYNQEDGIVINYDALQRGLFNTIHYRSYTIFEEDDKLANTKTRIAHPTSIPRWTDLSPGKDFSKLDDSGIIKVGTYVDENTVLVSRYMELPSGAYNDASSTAQVWTKGRVESIVILVNNNGLRTVKIRCVEYRIPELGDKFSNRHGQKGTIGMVVRSHDLPRTAQGIVPDMIMNTHAIPSRMTIGHVIEMVSGKVAANLGSIADGTAFTDDGRLTKQLNSALEQLGFEKYGNEILYDGTTGKQHSIDMFIGPIFSMRLKHMVEDKWNARGKGRREQKTHQPTGGRGAQGGLRIGEMERDAILGHGISAFTNESYMLRSDGVSFRICKGCGTIPIENQRKKLFVCPLCTGPVSYIGSNSQDLELVPPSRKSMVSPATIEIPYAFKLLSQELETFMNIGMRILTDGDVITLDGVSLADLPDELETSGKKEPVKLPERILPERSIPEDRKEEEGASEELLEKLGVEKKVSLVPLVPDADDIVVDGSSESQVITLAKQAVENAKPAVETGTLVNTSKGQMFQPNATTVTVVPPAKKLRILGEPEAIEADEQLPSLMEQQQPMQQQPMQQQPMQQQPMQQQPMQQQPMQQQPMQQQPMQQLVQSGGYFPQYGMQPGFPINTGTLPAVFAQGQPAHIFSNNSIAVDTNNLNLVPKPMNGAAKGTRKKQAGGFSEAGGVVVTVSKGS